MSDSRNRLQVSNGEFSGSHKRNELIEEVIGCIVTIALLIGLIGVEILGRKNGEGVIWTLTIAVFAIIVVGFRLWRCSQRSSKDGTEPD